MVVVLSKEDYIKEADHQLNNNVYYQQLTADPTSQHISEVKHFVRSMFERRLINKKDQRFSGPSPTMSSEALPITKNT